MYNEESYHNILPYGIHTILFYGKLYINHYKWSLVEMKENKPINKTIDAMVWTKQISKIYLPIHNNVFTNMPSSFFPFLWNIYWKYVVYHGNNLAWHYTTKADNNSSWYKQVRYKVYVCVFFLPFFLFIFDSQVKRKKSILFGTISLLSEKGKKKKKEEQSTIRIYNA